MAVYLGKLGISSESAEIFGVRTANNETGFLQRTNSTKHGPRPSSVDEYYLLSRISNAS